MQTTALPAVPNEPSGHAGLQPSVEGLGFGLALYRFNLSRRHGRQGAALLTRCARSSTRLKSLREPMTVVLRREGCPRGQFRPLKKT
jgi:hypothetical protein